MNNNAAGSPVWRPRRSVTGATLSWRASLACMSIRSAVAARNSMPTCRADPLTVCANRERGDPLKKNYGGKLDWREADFPWILHAGPEENVRISAETRASPVKFATVEKKRPGDDRR